MGDVVHLPASNRAVGFPGRRMKRKQVISCQLLTFTPNRLNDRAPVVGRDSPALLPLPDSPMTFTNVVGHLGNGLPNSEHVINRFHTTVVSQDNLSRKGSTTRPVTARRRAGTMRPMGKATTPTAFKKEFCQRLKAARIMAGFEQAEFAKELGLLPNTYNKYETRSLLPHYLIPQACEILGIEPAVLFSGPRESKRRTA